SAFFQNAVEFGVAPCRRRHRLTRVVALARLALLLILAGLLRRLVLPLLLLLLLRIRRRLILLRLANQRLQLLERFFLHPLRRQTGIVLVAQARGRERHVPDDLQEQSRHALLRHPCLLDFVERVGEEFFGVVLGLFLVQAEQLIQRGLAAAVRRRFPGILRGRRFRRRGVLQGVGAKRGPRKQRRGAADPDRKSTRLNSSH